MPEEVTVKHTTKIMWENRAIQLTYRPRRWRAIDHVELLSENGEPLPITRTGYRSHFFGPIEPAMSLDEVVEMVVGQLDEEAQSQEWQTHLERSKQLTLF